MHAAMNALLSRAVLRMMSVQASSASSVTSNTFTPRSSSIATVAAMCSAPRTIRCVKLTVVTACCPGAGMMNMFGKPRVVMPCRLMTPSFHFSSIVMPSRPMIVWPARRGERRELGLEAGGVDDAVELVLGAVGDRTVLRDLARRRPGSRPASRWGG